MCVPRARSPNEADGEAQRRWINLLQHAVNHLHLRWVEDGGAAERGKRQPAGASTHTHTHTHPLNPPTPHTPAFLWRPPAAVGAWDEGASERDGKPSNQTPQVVPTSVAHNRPGGKESTGRGLFCLEIVALLSRNRRPRHHS